MNSSTCTLPYAHTRPRSLRPRSTSITCSARSLGSEQLRFQPAVFGFVTTARAGAGERVIVGVAALHLDEHLGRTAHDGDIAELQKIEIGRWIHHAQRTVHFKGIGGRAGLQPLAEHDLKGISGA